MSSPRESGEKTKTDMQGVAGRGQEAEGEAERWASRRRLGNFNVQEIQSIICQDPAPHPPRCTPG